MRINGVLNKSAATLCIISLLTACGGRTPNPVMPLQFGDQEKSCETLRHDLSSIENEIERLLPESDKTGKNVALGIAGWFLIVPLFFMDFKNAEAVEYEAYRQRYNNLISIAISKKCSYKIERLPSVEEMRKKYEAQKKEKGAEKTM